MSAFSNIGMNHYWVLVVQMETLMMVIKSGLKPQEEDYRGRKLQQNTNRSVSSRNIYSNLALFVSFCVYLRHFCCNPLFPCCDVTRLEI